VRPTMFAAFESAAHRHDKSDRSYTLIRHGQNASNDSLERRSASSVDLFASGLRDERERGSLTIGP
jgi:hypothetical protein